jgi:3-methyladenine DNA glycosylase AlkD
MGRKGQVGSFSAEALRAKLRTLADPEKAAVLQRFFKTGPGEYGEGDRFLGVRVPVLRKLAGSCPDMAPDETVSLLTSPVHEERFLALLLLIRRYTGGTASDKKAVYDLYLSHTAWINNWDLVDVSAQHIVGDYLQSRSKRPLYRLAGSSNLWERRISILSTFHYIKRGVFTETLKISELLLGDEADLIHKAVGWMLREVGKRHLETAEGFLRSHYRRMPRTMLRYAIEKLPEAKRQDFLKGTF